MNRVKGAFENFIGFIEKIFSSDIIIVMPENKDRVLKMTIGLKI